MTEGRISTNAQRIKAGRLSLLLVAVYVFLVVLLYFLAGDQFRYRESRYNMAMPTSESAITELTKDVVIEEVFATSIDRIKTISVQWGTYYRANSGTITAELFDTRDDSLLLSWDIAAEEIKDGECTDMHFPVPLEQYNNIPLRLRLISNSRQGNAVAPLMTSQTQNGVTLLIDRVPAEGSLCLAVFGEEYVWIGQHYWAFAGVLGILIVAFLAICYHRWTIGKPSLLVNAALAIKRYRFLIKQLVSRDFKTKYKRSALGVLWSFLNPLLTMSVQYAVFSAMFRFDIAHYPIYLLTGIVMFNYFSESCGLTLTAITGNASLITKVYVPKYIYPLTRVLSSLINLLISMIPLFLGAIISGLRPTGAYILALFPLACIALFCLGFGMLLATSMVFFRDTQFLWGILSMIWMYATPIFYPASILPPQIAWILQVNPLYHFIDFLRTCIIGGVSPDPRAYVACAGYALAMLMLGAFVFKKNQDKFVLYL